jgi:hypothetical protein
VQANTALSLVCQIFGSRRVSLEHVEKGSKFMETFISTFGELFPDVNIRIKPNFHMSLHLIDNIRDFGPFSAYWCFPFERFNGVLGSFSNNNRSPECTFMNHFLSLKSIPNVERWLLEKHNIEMSDFEEEYETSKIFRDVSLSDKAVEEFGNFQFWSSVHNRPANPPVVRSRMLEHFFEALKPWKGDFRLPQAVNSFVTGDGKKLLPIYLAGASEILSPATHPSITSLIMDLLLDSEIQSALGTIENSLLVKQHTKFYRKAFVGGVRFACHVDEFHPSNRDCFVFVRDHFVFDYWSNIERNEYVNSTKTNQREGSLLDREPGLVPARIFGFLEIPFGSGQRIGLLRYALVRYFRPCRVESKNDFGAAASTWQHCSVRGLPLRFAWGFRTLNDLKWSDFSLIPLTSLHCKCAAYVVDHFTIALVPVLSGA